MDSALPFKPSGPTFAMGVTGAANPSATLLGSGIAGDVSYRFYNSGGDAFLSFGPTSAAASTGAVIPIISGGPQSGLMIKGGDTRVFTLNGNPLLFCAAINVAGSSTIYATPGFGIA